MRMALVGQKEEFADGFSFDSVAKTHLFCVCDPQFRKLSSVFAYSVAPAEKHTCIDDAPTHCCIY